MNSKWSLVFLSLVVVLAVLFFYRQTTAPSMAFDQLSLLTTESEPFTFNSLKGKKTIVSFGASWCGNCIVELDMLKKIKDSELQDVQVVVISDESLEKIRFFKDRRNYPFIFLKVSKSFSDLGVNSIPTSYLLNPDLEIKKEKVGDLNWLDPSNRAYLLKLMD